MTEGEARKLIAQATGGPPEQAGLFTALPVQVEGFADCWATYPKRRGTNNSKEAEREYLGCIKRGAKAEEIKRGTMLYRERMDREGSIGTQYVLQGKNFFKSEQWRDEIKNAGDTTGPIRDRRTDEANARTAHGAAVMAGSFIRNTAQRR